MDGLLGGPGHQAWERTFGTFGTVVPCPMAPRLESTMLHQIQVQAVTRKG
jgi:hypothetical protein